MTAVTFARTRYNYESYSDFWRLVELSGYPVCYVDEMQTDDPARCYILTPANGEWGDGWPGAKARLIFADLEWRLNGHSVYEPPHGTGIAETWACDAWYARRIGARYVPLGSHPGLNPRPDDKADDRPFDYTALSYLTYRRLCVRDAAAELGVTFGPNGWGENRHATLLRSHALLHVHQHNAVATIAPLRWAIAAAYRLPVVSEMVEDAGLIGNIYSLFCEFNLLPTFLARWRKDVRLVEYGAALHNLLCVEHPFRRCVDGAL